MNFRLAMLIAIGPSVGGHAHWIIANDSTPQSAGLRPTSRWLRRRKGKLFLLRCVRQFLALSVTSLAVNDRYWSNNGR